MRRLIINADDYGLTPGVNRAIIEAHQNGVVTSTTMMANAAATCEGARLLSTAETLSIGCHVVLIDGRPILPANDLRTLVSFNSADACFRTSVLAFAAAAMRGHLRAEEIAAETRAQIAVLQSIGIRVSHLDSHKHTHLLPPVLKPLLRAARECGVHAVRNPLGPVHPPTPWHLLRRPRFWRRHLQFCGLRHIAAGFRRAVESENMVTTDGTLGIVATGGLDQPLFRDIVASIPEGTWELVCHPGYCDDDLRAVRTRLRESRVKELEVLTSMAAREALRQNGVELISYWDL